MRLILRNAWLVVVVVFYVVQLSTVHAGELGPKSFRAKAKLAVKDRVLSLSYATAIHQKLARGYSRLWIRFFSYAPTPEDIVEIMKGSTDSMERRVYSKELSDSYNSSTGWLTVGLDPTQRVGQVDMGIPGYGCTVVKSDKDLAAFAKGFRFDDKHVKLAVKGSFDCGKISSDPNQGLYTWDVNLKIPVFEETPK